MTVAADDDPVHALAECDEAVQRWDVDAAIAHLAAAVRGFTRAGDVHRAAMASAQLGTLYAEMLGNRTAGRPWLLRAMRLLEHEPPCVEQGWVAVAAVGCEVDDPATLHDRADLALARARQFADVDLEIKALADGGLARVQLGLVDEGMAMIDEAMALACTDGSVDAVPVGKAVCSFFTACYLLADFARVDTWRPLLLQRGLIGATPGIPAFLRSHCDSVQGTLLCHLGRWGDAERVLERALAEIEAAMPGSAWHPPIALAELRILQGRLHDAEALLLGRDGHLQALVPAARLHLARGDHDLARSTARRGLALLGEDRLRATTLLTVLVAAELGRGDLVAATAAADELDARAAGLDVPAVQAEAARARAAVLDARGEHRAAITTVERALTSLSRLHLPMLEATLHLDLARFLEQAGDRSDAAIEATRAGALLEPLEVVLSADDAALVDRLGSWPARRGRGGAGVATLERGGRWWTVRCDGVSARLADTKGLRYLADLVAHPSSERHALDLVDLVEGVAAPDTGIDRRRLGDAGPQLDAAARQSYRRRVAELRDEIEDALAVEDDERAAASQRDLDAIVGELSRAFGLGGRDRVASSAAEKARLNVTRAVRAAIAKVAEALPDAGAVLDRRVRTGLYCTYAPAADDPVTWIVRSALNGTTPT
jgi:tetratricopeptide (TPR) repeat protein